MKISTFGGETMYEKQCEPCGQFFTTLSAPVEDEYVVCSACRSDMARVTQPAFRWSLSEEYVLPGIAQ